MTSLPPTTLTHDHSTPEHGLSLADRLHEGEEFAVTFGGQGEALSGGCVVSGQRGRG